MSNIYIQPNTFKGWTSTVYVGSIDSAGYVYTSGNNFSGYTFSSCIGHIEGRNYRCAGTSYLLLTQLNLQTNKSDKGKSSSSTVVNSKVTVGSPNNQIENNTTSTHSSYSSS